MANPVSGEMLPTANNCIEKQISVDPISLKESYNREASANPVEPVVTAPNTHVLDQLPPLLPPAKPKFLSCSLPNSATSSPRFGSSLLKKKWRNESQASPQQFEDLTHLQHSASYKALSLQQEIHYRRSKSCGEGRSCAPSDDFDLWLIKPNAIENGTSHYSSSFSKIEPNKAALKNNNMDPSDDGFKCGALCLFLPGFSKAKQVRPRKEEAEMRNRNVISRTVSLEKFECGSWASSAVINDHEDGDSMSSHYFDLPLELIRCANDAHSPVTTAFVFDKDRKGVLKNGSSRTSAARKSHESSSRHVRFSTSSPTSYPASPASCITPRLRKAREEFNAFLEAQSA